ncbi:MAG: short-chain dehydrogenase [Gammaproteobacteria bacterium CG_4_10_14_0_8_um_filter_38_16]|nr:MAG: short-chain dehydrogenase [Gammaproteobacteria bacterium CG_4_10_14_0_8_um_filter_38_16]PJA04392.1 MAG: short-chain dehydrogenase [Gammaproteobacteria bacterium CG_4_10_14_0_2_um_filter_38_22]PJB10187.1 MAG: short-chain dehydrogenase [Gammaproteobacteria bacterium CG_4_9_14_3_um_filter_38_9]
MTQKCWIIAGATSAIATCFAHIAAKKGDQLILLGRDLEKLTAIQNDLQVRYRADVSFFAFDALKTDEHEAIAVSCLQCATHPISLLVAFGAMISGSASTHSRAEMLTTIDTNFTGAVSITGAFLPFFKKQKQGHILFLGSVAGDRGRASNFDYGSAKAALVPFCDGLRATLRNDHVSVTLMKMGYIDTPMIYGKPGVFLVAKPMDCARACWHAAENKVAMRYFPWFWRWIMLIFKMIPRFVMSRINV